MFDLNAFVATPLQVDPYDFVVVPAFVKPETLKAVNRDFPEFEHAGAVVVDELTYGPAFEAMVEKLKGSTIQGLFEKKFGLDLGEYSIMMTARKYSEPSDGNIHTDSKGKIITILIYFNTEWNEEGGRLRVLRSSRDIDDYAVEVQPVSGTLLAFRRSDRSYHGFKSCQSSERRLLQMHWVVPKRAHRDATKKQRFTTHVKRLIKKGTWS